MKHDKIGHFHFSGDLRLAVSLGTCTSGMTEVTVSHSFDTCQSYSLTNPGSHHVPNQCEMYKQISDRYCV